MIQSLPTEVVHRIAAGEVIDSLAAVVRELAENAIDAGATRIAIAVSSDSAVRVCDNGCGMGLTDLERAALPHSTSKIQHLTDLEAIASLGFRGEALFSLAQLADLQIASRGSDGEGWQIVYDRSGKPGSIRQVAIAQGTIVTVDNLFANLASRSQSLPSFSQQLRQVQMVIQQLAIAQSQISWQIELSSQPEYSIYAGRVEDILIQILPRVQMSDLVSGGDSEIQITMGLSDRLSRARADWLKLVVNGRVVQLPEIEQTILSAFAQTLPRHRFPVCIVTLQIPPDRIDWNRLPSKRVIYLRNLTEWQNRIQTLIAQLQRSPNSSSQFYSELNPILKFSPKLAEINQNYAVNARQPEIKVIAQVQQTYILAENSQGILLIEQHVAHERVLFELIEQEWEIIPINPPLILEKLSEEKSERLAKLGIEIEAFGQETWLVRSLPKILLDSSLNQEALNQNQGEELAEILHELAQTADLPTAKATAACRSAIRNGKVLDLAQMQNLVNQWQACRSPRTCPHGRPICMSLDSDRLARFFRRNWLIKS
jgi:DNA mismatch repair protein MutL